MSKWPQLVHPRWCKTQLHVIVESEDLGEDGAPLTPVDWTGYCNYQAKAHKVYNADKVLVDVTGTCLIPGDIAPTEQVSAGGYVYLDGTRRDIAIGTKACNPDGTVNYTQIELR